MPESATLRESILRDFGLDLPIRGGCGTQAEPVVITTDTLQEAVNLQMQVLQCVCAGRGAAWRLTGQEVVAAGEKLVRSHVETLVTTGVEYAPHNEAFDFVLEALPMSATAIALPAASAFADDRSGVEFPCQLGWLHLVGATDNEPENPGLGWSIAYRSPGIEGTVYLYDEGTPLASDVIESERVIEAFRRAVVDALSVNPGAEVKHQASFRGPSGLSRCLMAILDLPGDSMSAVLMSARSGCLVKARMTFDATERQVGRMAHESMEAFVEAVRPESGSAS
jgi:hypothetical protein